MPDQLTNFMQQMMAARMAENSQFRAGNSPQRGGGGMLLGQPSTDVRNVQQTNIGVDLGAIGNVLDRFGLLPKRPEQLRQMGMLAIKEAARYPEAALVDMENDPGTQAMFRKYYKNQVPGFLPDQSGVVRIQRDLIRQNIPEQVQANVQLVGPQMAASEQGIMSGQMGAPVRDAYRENWPGGFRRPIGKEEALMGANLFVPAAKQEIDTEAAKATALKSEADYRNVLGPAHANYYNAAADATREKATNLEDPEQKAIRAMQAEEAKRIMGSQNDIRRAYMKAVTTPNQLESDKVGHAYQYNTMSLNNLHGLKMGGIPGDKSYMQAVAQDFLNSARAVASVPRDRTMVSGMFSKPKVGDSWNQMFIGLYHNIDEFQKQFGNELGPHAMNAASKTKLDLIDKMDTKVDSKFQDEVALEFLRINDTLLRQNPTLKPYLQAIATRKGWSPDYLMRIAKQSQMGQ